MSIALQILLGLLVGYLLATLAESFLHHHVAHAGARVRKFWLRHPRFFAPFLRSYYSHHVIHHARTYRGDYVTQFRSKEEQEALDRAMPPHWLERIKREEYGLTLKGWGILLFVGPVLPVVPLLYWLAGPWTTGAAVVPLLFVYPLMSKWIHPLLHLAHDDALGRATPLQAWLLRTRYMKAVLRGHYLHHRYITCNYNLLLGGDFLRGVHRRSSPRDLEEMARLGLPVD
jgi:hypothetical protein